MTIIASMATIKKRNSSLKEVYDSIINQVSELNIYLNDYDDFNDIDNQILNDERVNLFLGKDNFGDLGASGKFFINQNKNAYHFTVDDDIVYPKNYVEVMIKKCGEYKNAAIISLHGRNFIKFPISSYYNDINKRTIHFMGKNPNDVEVQFPGTGVMCYSGSIFSISYRDFKTKNMTDVWIGILAKQNDVKCIAINHEPNWLKPIIFSDSIYDRGKINDSERTELVNKYFK